MCGIIGYIGNKPALPIIIGGLERLEYRGYDSAGVALLENSGKFQLHKRVGKLSNLTTSLKEELLNEEAYDCKLGVGHTRWATHGKPTEGNAHPHRSPNEQVIVVHNGIIENYVGLKERLANDGYRFSFLSETDTEVLAHLLERYMTVEGLSLELAMEEVLGVIKGTAAIVAFTINEPDKIVCARLSNAGAVVIGYGQEGEMFVASDIPAILPHTRRMSFLDSGEVAVLTREGASFFNQKHELVQKEIITSTADAISAAKGGYKHFMLKEIHDQPQAISDTLLGRVDLQAGKVRLDTIKLSENELAEIEKVTITACGTSWHAGLVGKFLIEELAGLPVEVDYSSEFRYRDPILSSKNLLVAITQSGETVDTLAAMEEAQRKGTKLISIVNVVGSQAARIADGVIYMQAGPEIGVASTKAFTASLVDLVLLAVYLGQLRKVIKPQRALSLLNSLVLLPKLIEATISEDRIYDQIARKITNANDFLYLGRWINYPVALEGALKLKELSYIHAEGYPAGEMKHGPIALVNKDLPVVAIATKDKVYDKVVSAIEQVKARDGWVLAIGTEGDNLLAEKADQIIYLPETDPLLTPVLAALPMQLLSYYIAVRRGCDVDQPRNLAKSVTVE
ncbi:MAG: glutamine--fructose-6-phosphate transaminase (isomerizing) [Chloroflexi bacterium]|uniref:Glutamine--fructose-6-phosphate aminotransferase [isomerizing] n=1 Tax=Candidatus Chlorohelix allophototropha TaxID=3003348 RepID=A0A8T7M776_9CHLR|nr:glutamine--fructose-6-phosphate transaminase (isomerizing) [Chloroflexota bacterium]WJW69873.1 glutamine--fructose-6-phosphate transaminase (isomerizing) [Chloroflexota bacterium L227-S17]